MKYSLEKTGFPARETDDVRHSETDGERPLSMAWIPEDLLVKTRRVWSRAYGRPVGDEEAAEILMNVKHMAEALMKAKRGGDAE